MKVFCTECDYLREIVNPNFSAIYWCAPPTDDIVETIIKPDTWLRSGETIIRYRKLDPKEHNKDNNCGYFYPMKEGKVRKPVYCM